MNFLKDREGYFYTNRALVKLILPIVAEQFLQVLVGMADSIMVSSVGEAAVSGVSLVDTVVVLLINAFSALAAGGAVVAGHFLGQKKEEQACRAVNQLVLFTVVFSAAIMGLVYLGRPFILQVVFGKIEADVYRSANLYLLIVAASIPMIALYNAGAAVFRMMGNSRTAMFMSLLMNGINITGNAILLYGLRFGVEGAAIPTLVSRLIACAIMTGLLLDQKRLLHLTRPFTLRFEWPILKKVLAIGVPNGLENSMIQLGKIMVLSIISACGTASIAANSISNTLGTFQTLPGLAIGSGMLTIVAQCVGAGRYDQVRYYTKKLIAASHVLLAGATLIVVLLLPSILNAYQLSDTATTLAWQLIVYHGVCCICIWPESFGLPNVLRASNDVRYCMWVSIASMWIFRIGMSWVLAIGLELGVFGAWMASTIDWTVRAILFLIRYRRGKWQMKRG